MDQPGIVHLEKTGKKAQGIVRRVGAEGALGLCSPAYGPVSCKQWGQGGLRGLWACVLLRTALSAVNSGGRGAEGALGLCSPAYGPVSCKQWGQRGLRGLWACVLLRTALSAVNSGGRGAEGALGLCSPAYGPVSCKQWGQGGLRGLWACVLLRTALSALRTKGLTSHLLLCVSLLSVVLLLLLVFTSVVLVVALNRRATRGTYSPSRQEKDGSRVEMWSITQPPPTERLI
uniref:Uncharacterized protein n=1 Tax=Knipowitschia caucasica TaxID=637954 RepID=A0AAV2KU12_KNICA